MNKLILVLALLIVGCATPRNPDGTIDACKLTTSPKEAKLYETHAADLLEYPENIPVNYTGCQKTWIANFYGLNKHHLLLTLKFKDGLLSQVQSLEPKQEKVVCEFDENKSISSGSPDDCLPYEKWLRSE